MRSYCLVGCLIETVGSVRDLAGNGLVWYLNRQHVLLPRCRSDYFLISPYTIKVDQILRS